MYYSQTLAMQPTFWYHTTVLSNMNDLCVHLNIQAIGCHLKYYISIPTLSKGKIVCESRLHRATL